MTCLYQSALGMWKAVYGAGVVPFIDYDKTVSYRQTH
jgi:hypothetical protein